MENRNLLTFEKVLALAGIIIVASIFRILPHPPNVAPVTAIALFSGSHLSPAVSIVVPLLTMIISDTILGFHNTIIFVYGSFALIALLGGILKKKQCVKRIFAVSMFSSVLFFIITNFGVFLTNEMYTKNLSGLIQCYYMGLPFFRNTILGDLTYTIILFYGFSFLVRSVKTFILKFIPQ